MSLLDKALTGVPDKWRAIIADPELEAILAAVEGPDTVPSLDKVFEWARLTPFERVRVVILAQDPYPNDNACGLAFSSKRSPSAANIFKALMKSGLIAELPATHHLHRWAAQGILLLNRSLTTVRGESNAHRKLWTAYTQRLVGRLEEAVERELIFLLWGENAKSIQCAGRRLEYSHPSPLNRGCRFEDCSHFSEVNLVYPDIDWNTAESKVAELMPAVPRESLYTDGSCFPNNKSPMSRGGFAVVLPNRGLAVIGSLDCSEYAATNIRSEGMAILEAMRYYKKNGMSCGVDLYTDSEFWLRMVESYMPKWSEAERLSKANPDLTAAIAKGWRIVGAANFKLHFIPSHGKKGTAGTEHSRWNEVADKAANYARIHLKSGNVEVVELTQFV